MIKFINPRQKRLIRKIFAPIRRLGLKNRDFSIIANNCFASFVYDIYALPYRTPTIGLYFYPDEYLKFVSNLKENLTYELEPLDFKDSRYQKELLQDHNENALLAKFNDIEVVLLHHHDFLEAKKKWERRCKRVNFDNIVIKFSDQNYFKDSHYEAFKKLDFKNKLFFTANRNYLGEDYSYFIKKFDKEGYALDDLKSSKRVLNYKKYFNALKKEKEK